MPLVVLNVAYPFAPVAPDAADDTVQAVVRLDAALVRAGNESIVMACEGSVIDGILLETHLPSDGLDDAGRRLVYDQYRFTLGTFLKKWPIDIIHMHGVDFYEYIPPPGVPVLVTLHSPIDLYPESIFHLERPGTFLNCISSWQRQNCPACANLLPETEAESCAIDHYLRIYDTLVTGAIEIPVGETAEISLARG